MTPKIIKAIACFSLLAGLGAVLPVRAQNSQTQYPQTMAPLDQYLMDRDAEIALARSAAPASISRDAEVLVLGPKGYETAVKGRNGFVCLVDRSWTDTEDNDEFWNPKRRGPMCLNPEAARSALPNTIMRAKLALAGRSKAEMFEALKAAYDKKELPEIETGAMIYMMSKEGHLSDQDGHWHPHLMFFLPANEAEALGTAVNTADRVTVLTIRVAKWSDGTPDSPEAH